MTPKTIAWSHILDAIAVDSCGTVDVHVGTFFVLTSARNICTLGHIIHGVVERRRPHFLPASTLRRSLPSRHGQSKNSDDGEDDDDDDVQCVP